MTAQPNLEDDLPLTETVLLILLALAPGARHGYAIMQDVDDMSEGRVVFSTGTLYGALRRLLDKGWIERVETGEVARDRKDYRLTDLGRRVLNAETRRLQALTTIAQRRLTGGEA